MRRRMDAFGLLLGGVPALEDQPSDSGHQAAAQPLTALTFRPYFLNRKHGHSLYALGQAICPLARVGLSQ